MLKIHIVAMQRLPKDTALIIWQQLLELKARLSNHSNRRVFSFIINMGASVWKATHLLTSRAVATRRQRA